MYGYHLNIYEIKNCGIHGIYIIRQYKFFNKAGYGSDGHKTVPISTLTKNGVVARESVRSVILITAFKDILVLGADVHINFLMEPNHEKLYLIVVS